MSLLLLLSGAPTGPPVPPGTPIEPVVYLEDYALEVALSGSYSDAVLADSPVGFWMLGDYFTTATVEDLSGNNYDGAYAGGMTFGQRGPFPHGGTAIALNGTTGYVDMGDVAALEFVSAFSVEMWVKFTSAQSVCYWASKGFGDVPNGWTVGGAAGCVTFFHTTLTPGVVFSTTTTGTYNDGLWHHVVCTWDGTTGTNKVRIYVDSVLVAYTTANASTPGAPATARMIIGAKDQTGSGSVAGHFDGAIKGVALYNTELSAARVAAHYATSVWTDITADVLTSPGISLEYGTFGMKPLNRLADSGVLEFSLNNSHGNSAGLSGYYSPSHVNVRPGFTFDIPVRVRLTYDGFTRDRFWGRISMIDPEPGQYRNRATHVMAHDYQFILADTDVRRIPPQLGQSEVTLIQRVFQALPDTAQPMALDLNGAVDTYPYAYDDIQGGVRAATALNKVIVSAWGRGFTKGDGTFAYRSRQAAIGLEIELAVDDQMMEMQSTSDRAEVFDQVRVVTHPRSIDAAATTILYTHPTAPFLSPGEVQEFFGDYRNPSNDLQTVGGTEMVTPVSGTDYIANSAADGSGTVLTGSVTATADFFASTVKWRIQNNHATLGAYFTTLQARGKGIYDQAPVTSTAPFGVTEGARPITIDLPYQGNSNTGQSLAEFILNERVTIVDPIESIVVSPHRSAALMAFAVECEPGELISVSETQTGLSEAQAMIRSIRLELKEGEILTTELGLIPSVVGEAWELDVDQLDISTVLGYA